MDMTSYWDLAAQAASVLMSENSNALNLESADAVGVVTAVFALAVQVLSMYDSRRTGTDDGLALLLFSNRAHERVNQRAISGILSSTPYLLGVTLYFMLIGPLSGSFGQFLTRLFDLGGFVCVVSLFSSVMCLGSCLTKLHPSCSVVNRVIFGLAFGLLSAFIGAATIALNNSELVPWLVFIAYILIYWLFGHFGRHHVLKMKTPPEFESSIGSWGGASLVLLVTCTLIVACHVAIVPLANLPAIQIVSNETFDSEGGTTTVRKYNPLLLAVENTRYGSDGKAIITFYNQFDFTRKVVSYQGYWPDGSQATNAKVDYGLEEMLEDVRANSSMHAYRLSDDGTGASIVACSQNQDMEPHRYQVDEYDSDNSQVLFKRSFYNESLELDYYYVYNYEEDSGDQATGGTTYYADGSFSNAFSFEYYTSGVMKKTTYYDEAGNPTYTYSYDESGKLISS